MTHKYTQGRNAKNHALLALLFLLLGGNAWGQATQITTKEGLESILANATNAAADYIIKADFNAAGYNPTNWNTQAFTGTLTAGTKDDGTFYTISGLDKPLFKIATNATISNIILDEVSISKNYAVGAIADSANGATRIYNCGILSGYVGSTGAGTDSPKQANCCGGLVGLLDGTARVINCYSYATITGGNRVAGIVGYNNGTTTSASINTMVMNCMFYGDITGGSKVSPVYGGNLIDNLKDQNGLNTFNFYAYEKLKTKTIDFYNCALAIEERFLTRFEIYRQLLNSNKKLAAWYATGSVANGNQMAKWVLETADRNIANPKPYPILKQRGRFYPSIINPDFTNAPDSTTVGPNKGGKLGRTLSVTIKKPSEWTNAPSNAKLLDELGNEITTSRTITLTRTDKDFDRFNYNYDKVQLPYYNDIGTGNYTGSRVVTGWKITNIFGGTAGTYTAADQWNGYNFADRKCTNKDLYGTNGSNRVFAQGAYWDVPYGVTAITIEPYWGKAAFLADEYYDYVFTSSYGSKTGITAMGKQVDGTIFNGVSVTTSVDAALGTITSPGSTVYDNAIVLVGNFHQSVINNVEPFKSGTKPFTLMSIDADNDHEPDYSLIYHDNNRSRTCPIRFDFLNIPGTAQAQKPKETSTMLNASVFKPSSWFEITNTCNIFFSQFEYEYGSKTAPAPIILLGGVYDQFTSTKDQEVKYTTYLHVGSNAWFKSFGNGTHSDGNKKTKHIPISVTGGDFDGFYLTGTYRSDAAVYADNAECYISSGHFKEAAGAGLEQINGNVQWQIYNADIEDFYGGGIKAPKTILGDVTVDIFNSHVGTYCGGPKFGDMQSGKDVTTNAIGCEFEKFFGAGYGGNSMDRRKYFDSQTMQWTTWQNKYSGASGDKGKYYDGTTTGTGYGSEKKGKGVAVDFDYEFLVWTSGGTGGRFFVKFVTFSLAQCNNVNSTLTRCTINGNFYGGGSLGKVGGTATSVLDGCMVKGNVYGAGYSATLPTIPVRDAGFKPDPNNSGQYLIPSFNKYSGIFEDGEVTGTTEYTWKQGTLPSDGGSGFDGQQVITDVDLRKTNLGSVNAVSLTIKGNSTINGNVFGGGEESRVVNDTEVKILEQTKVYGNIYGGGNMGEVTGDTKVIVNGLHTR